MGEWNKEQWTNAGPSSDDIRCTEWRPSGKNGHNLSFVSLVDPEPNWFLKRCRTTGGGVPDLCEREVLASCLGHILDVPVVRSWCIACDVNGILGNQPNGGTNDWISDRLVVMPYLKGHTVEEQPCASAFVLGAHSVKVGELLAFMHWIGDEDRGRSDVFVENDRFVLIDNGLTGPSRKSKLRGAHPQERDFLNSPHQIVKKCFPGKPSFVAFLIRDCRVPREWLESPPVIERIESLDTNRIRPVVEYAGLPSYVTDELAHRANLIRAEYSQWVSSAWALLAHR